MVKLGHGDEFADVFDDKGPLFDLVVDSQAPAARCRSRHLHLWVYSFLKPLVAAFVAGKAGARPAFASEESVEAL